jgi:hypothetical protein
MKLIATYCGPYYARLNNGKLFACAEVTREVWWDGDSEEIYFSADACEQIDKAIQFVYPGYFTIPKDTPRMRDYVKSLPSFRST